MPKRQLPPADARITPRLWRLGEFELDESRPALRRGEVRVALEPKPFKLLLVLIRHAGQVVTHQQLLDQLWEGRAVSDAVISRCASKLRSALGQQQDWVRTVHGQGYRYDGPVTPPDDGSPLPPLRSTAAPDAPVTPEPPAVTAASDAGVPEPLPQPQTPPRSQPAPLTASGPVAPRRRKAWALSTALVLALCVALGLLLKAHRVQNQAETALAEAETINRFMDNALLPGANPLASDDSGEPAMATLLDAAAEKLRHAAYPPAVAARLTASLGGGYDRLALFQPATALLDSGLKAAEATLGSTAVETNLLRMRLAATLTRQGSLDRALLLYQRAVRELPSASGGQTTTARESLFAARVELGRLQWLRGQFADCATQLDASLAAVPPGMDALRIADTQWSLARCLTSLQQYERAGTLLDEARAAASDWPGTPPALLSRIDLGRCDLWGATGRWAEVRQLAIAIGQQPRGSLSAQYLVSLDAQDQQALALLRLGQVSSARTLLEGLYRQRLDQRGDGDRASLLTVERLGEALLRDGAAAQAMALLAPAYTRSRQALGGAHPLTLGLGNTLAEALAAGGDLPAATTLSDTVIDTASTALPSGHPALARALMTQGVLRLLVGDTEAARSAADAADKALQQSQAATSPLRAATRAAVESGDFSLRWRL